MLRAITNTFVESLLRDLKFAVRSFGKDRAWTTTVLVTLTIGIGVSAAIFSVVNAVLLNPLPYKDPDRLVMLWAVNEEAGYDLEHQREQAGTLSSPELEDWKRQSGIFEDVVYFSSFWWDFVADGQAGRVFGWQVSGGALRMLGVKPKLGRFFVPEDHKASSPPVVVLLHECWLTQFHGDPGVIGKRVTSGKTIYTIIGVAPQGFTYYKRGVDMLVPGSWGGQIPRRGRWFRAMGRLKGDVTLAAAQSRADVFSRRLAEAYPDSNKGWRLRIVPLLDESVARFRPALVALFGAVCFVLLAMSFNIANLFLARAAMRAREIGIRSAIGAGRGRLVRQLLTESLLISLCGAMLGLGLAAVLVRYLRMLFPWRRGNWAQQMVQLESIHVDTTVALFACAVAILTGLFFAALPALTATSPNLTLTLKGLTHGLGTGVSGRKSQTLVIAQVAVSVILVFGAGLLARSMLRVYTEGTGFRDEGLLALNVSAPGDVYMRIQAEAKAAGLTRDQLMERFRTESVNFRTRLVETLSSVPGVRSITAAGDIPLRPQTRMVDVAVEGQIEAKPVGAVLELVEPNYFAVMGIPLLRGRVFDSQDRFGSAPVVVINQKMARRCFPGEEAVGKRVRAFGPAPMTVIGIVGDTRPNGLGTESLPSVYLSASQSFSFGGIFILRTSGDPALFVAPVRQAVYRDNGTNPTRLTGAFIMSGLAKDSAWQINFSTVLLVGLATLALLLAAVGLYGVMSYSVRGSTREIGIRLALGEEPAQVRGRIVLRGIVLVVLGLLPGLLLAGGLARYLGSLLYGVRPLDAITTAAVVFTFVLAAIAASYFPASRAAKLDPMTALRYE